MIARGGAGTSHEVAQETGERRGGIGPDRATDGGTGTTGTTGTTIGGGIGQGVGSIGDEMIVMSSPESETRVANARDHESGIDVAGADHRMTTTRGEGTEHSPGFSGHVVYAKIQPGLSRGYTLRTSVLSLDELGVLSAEETDRT